MAIVMYYGTDDRVVSLLEQMFRIRNDERGDSHILTRITDPQKLGEALAGVNFDLILVEQSFLELPPAEWLVGFQKRHPRVKSPMVLVGDESDPIHLLKIIESGFADYIVNPPDKLLLIEKFGLYTTGSRHHELRQVYSLKLSQRADLAKPGQIEELSEFDCKIRSSHSTAIGEMLLLYSKAFSSQGNENVQVIGRCYEVREHAEFKGQFLASYYFLAVTPDILTNIRNSLRKSYVAGKTKS